MGGLRGRRYGDGHRSTLTGRRGARDRVGSGSSPRFPALVRSRSLDRGSRQQRDVTSVVDINGDGRGRTSADGCCLRPERGGRQRTLRLSPKAPCKRGVGSSGQQDRDPDRCRMSNHDGRHLLPDMSRYEPQERTTCYSSPDGGRPFRGALQPWWPWKVGRSRSV